MQRNARRALTAYASAEKGGRLRSSATAICTLPDGETRALSKGWASTGGKFDKCDEEATDD